MARDNQAYGQYKKAVDTLATGTSDIRTRISHAAIPVLIMLLRKEFSDEVAWNEHSDIMRTIKSEGTEGTIEARLAAMSNEECVAVAGRIVDLCFVLSKSLQD